MLVYYFPVEDSVRKEEPFGGTMKELPSLAEELGGQRLALLAELLGPEAGARAAEEAGLYQLGDSLAQRLQLQGVSLGAGGEFPCLSPARWEPGAAHDIPAGTSATLLSDADAREFGAFLKKNGVPPPADPRAFAELARHYFFDRRLRVSVRS